MPIACGGAPPGYENLGNTCFLNAVMQALSNSELLVAAVDRSQHCEYCTALPEDTCVLCKVESHIKQVAVSTTRTIAPRGIVDSLPFISTTLLHGQMEDAHEFLRNLVSGMQMSLARDLHDNVDEGYPFSLFRGSLHSQVFCTRCAQVTVKADPIEDLELEVSRCSTLETALDDFCQVEVLSGANAFSCETCGQLTTAHRRMQVHRVPAILSIQLKRFAVTNNGQGRPSKITHFVEYPQVLQLSPERHLTSDSSTSTSSNKSSSSSSSSSSTSSTSSSSRGANTTSMELFAVVVHLGSAIGNGHYIAYLHCPDDSWYRVDDTHVSKVSAYEALSQSAYLLFYQRCSGTPRQTSSTGLTRPPTSALAMQGVKRRLKGDASGAKETRKRRQVVLASGSMEAQPTHIPASVSGGTERRLAQFMRWVSSFFPGLGAKT